MTLQHPFGLVQGDEDAGRRLAQLSLLEGLVSRIAGHERGDYHPDQALDHNAKISAVYGDALPIVRKRFDALAGETAHWAAAVIEVLLAKGQSQAPPIAAARRLADELAQARRSLEALLAG